MTSDDIIRMAREVGFDVDKKDGTYEVFEDDGYYIQTDRVIKLAALVAAAEREACAMVCEQWDAGHPHALASAIRARRNMK